MSEMRFWLWVDLVSITHAISWAKISNYDIIIEQITLYHTLLSIRDLAKYFTTTLHCRDVDILSDSSPLRCWLCLCRWDVEEKDRELCLLWLLIALFVGPQTWASGKAQWFEIRFIFFSCIYHIQICFFLFIFIIFSTFPVSIERQWAMEENTEFPIPDTDRSLQDPENSIIIIPNSLTYGASY